MYVCMYLLNHDNNVRLFFKIIKKTFFANISQPFR